MGAGEIGSRRRGPYGQPAVGKAAPKSGAIHFFSVAACSLEAFSIRIGRHVLSILGVRYPPACDQCVPSLVQSR